MIKYNKKFLNRLDITKKDFKAYEIIEEYNQKFNLDIEDLNINFLYLSDNNLKILF